MIRTITPEDASAVISLAVTSGLFAADETDVLEKMLRDYFGGNFDEGHRCVLDVEVEPLGVAYYAPKPATDGTWELILIAVKGDAQGHGRGAALLQYVENALRTAGQRLLLVETSGSADFKRTWAFYTKCGYQAEARVRDYYALGEDMVMFRKDLGNDNA